MAWDDDNKELLAEDDETAIKLLKDDTEATKLENIIIDDTGKATVKVKLRPKSDEDFKTLKDKFEVEEGEEEKIAKLFLKIACTGEDITHEKEFLEEDEFQVGFSNWNIQVHLRDDREEMGYGILLLKSGSKEIWRTIVRAQGFSSKIGESRAQQYADTPTGTYKFEQWRSDGSSTIYGSNPRLDMTYESGEAKSVGREEIQIHGGRQANSSNPYLWNTGGCLRVFDDAIVELKEQIESIGNSDDGNFIEVSNTLKYHDASEKYYTPEDYEELLQNSSNNTIIERGIIHQKYYRNESNYYTDNLN